ncbi:MAG: alpha-amylase family glycosyl hydrolase, partial [Bacteroidota bacterium]
MNVRLLFFAALVFISALSACSDARKSPAQDAQIPLSIPEAPPKIVIYQLLPRLFSNTETTNKTYGTLAENGVGKLNGITGDALKSLREFGITHVWFTGVLEHATMTPFLRHVIPADDADVVKGRAGSPYAIKDYYDIAPSLAENPDNRMAEFEHLLQRTHGAGLKAIMDFVPNHVARNYHSDARPEGVRDLGQDDQTDVPYALHNNFYYLPDTRFKVPKDHNPLGAKKAPGEDRKFDESPAKVTGNNVYSATPAVWDWFETVKLNYGVEKSDSGDITHFDEHPATWQQMHDILHFWAKKGVDGFRCDMAEMVPVEFWAWVIPEIKRAFPDIIFIAEIYNPSIYANYVETGAFDYLYDKVGVYDAVRACMSGKGETRAITEALDHSRNISNHMLRFLENHDEQRIASPEFAGDAWTAVPGMTVSALLGKGPVMLYFGQEHGERGEGEEGFQKADGRTTIFDY